MNQILTPSKVIEGNKKEIADFIKNLPEKTFLLLGEKKLFEMHKDFFEKAFKGKTKIFTDFFGECSLKEIQRILKSANVKKLDAIFGFGGGKALDTAKSVAEKSKLPLFVIPTSGATCAAFTSHSVIYGEKNEFLYEEQHSKSPDVVILCKEILKTQPRRLIYAGLADSIAKFWEFSFSEPKEKDPLFVEYSKEMAKQIISSWKADFYKLSFVTIIHTGIISAYGGKTFRSSSAHAISNAITQVFCKKPELKDLLHGELVGLGILATLIFLHRRQEAILINEFLTKTEILKNIKNAFRDAGEEIYSEISKNAIQLDPFFNSNNISSEDISQTLKLLCVTK